MNRGMPMRSLVRLVAPVRDGLLWPASNRCERSPHSAKANTTQPQPLICLFTALLTEPGTTGVSIGTETFSMIFGLPVRDLLERGSDHGNRDASVLALIVPLAIGLGQTGPLLSKVADQGFNLQPPSQLLVDAALAEQVAHHFVLPLSIVELRIGGAVGQSLSDRAHRFLDDLSVAESRRP